MEHWRKAIWLLSAIAFGAVATDAYAEKVTLTFDEVDFGTDSLDPLPVDAYQSFGILMSNFYWGTDVRDPFGDGQRAVSGIMGTTPTTTFLNATPLVEFQYWTAAPSWRILVRAYDASGAEVGSFSGPGTWSDGGGEGRLAGPNVKHITVLCLEPTGFSHGCGLVALSTLAFVRARVPESGTLALLSLGLVGLGLSRRRLAA
jgi:hypothetical protein